jgi:hypothetical protein
LLALTVFAFTACPPPTTNTNVANTNTNANTTASAPTAAELKAIETKAYEAFKNKDGQYFQTFLADNFQMRNDKGANVDKAASIKEISDHKCQINGFTLSDETVTPAGPNAAVLTTTVAADGTCEGKPIPTVTASTLFVNVGGQWKAAYHSEVPKTGDAATTGGNSNTDAGNRMANAANKAAETKANVNAKKEEVKSNVNSAVAAAKTPTPTPAASPASNTTASANTNTNSNANANASGTGDLNTTLAFVEKSLWQAWKDRQSGPLEDALAPEFVFINMDGKVIATKADVVREWTTPGCDVKSISIDSPQAVQVTENVALLMFKGNATGTCEGTPLKPVLGTTIFRREGVSWKPVYGISQPPPAG